ncbi:MAG TPA: glycerate kinase [Clostridia bacterium]|nr:glycerate kinase [Clostridia bacterium]
MPTFLIAPDSFKGTMSSLEVCEIIEKAVKDVKKDSKVVKLPVADGGEGLVNSFAKIKKGKTIKAKARGPYGELLNAEYFVFDSTAVIEMASCAGLPLVGDNKNPMKTTTLGVGDLILDAMKRDIRNIVLGLGGSATNDCAIGMANALGYNFLDKEGTLLYPNGEALNKIKTIIRPQELPPVEFVAACDVDNPLYGRNGAAYTFAPQKGADDRMVEVLDKGLMNIAKVIKTDFGIDLVQIKGAGAAGGMGAGVVAFLNGSLRSGIDLILDAAGFDELLNGVDIVITGEGCMDSQSLRGKVPFGVAKRATAKGKKVIAVCGMLGEGAEKMHTCGITAMYASRKDKADIETIRKTCKEDLYTVAKSAIKDLNL